MITERKIKQIAEKNQINPYYQEKEYLQHVFLNAISGEEDMVFKGGTCLKICYQLPRFSEDLDFNTSKKPEEIEKTVKKALKAYEKLGIEVETEKSEKFKETSSYTAHLRFKAPLYKEDNPRSTNTIQLDAGSRTGTNLETQIKQVTPAYPDIPAYFLETMNIREIMAEKIAAMNNRQKGRDLFDIWYLLDQTEIEKKLVQNEIKGETTTIRLPNKEEYERDLKDLTHNHPPYQSIRKQVEKEMKSKGLQIET